MASKPSLAAVPGLMRNKGASTNGGTEGRASVGCRALRPRKAIGVLFGYVRLLFIVLVLSSFVDRADLGSVDTRGV